MGIPQRQLLFSILIITVLNVGQAFPALEQEYNLEAYQKEGDAHTLVLKIRPSNARRQPRQDEDDDDAPTNTNAAPTTRPFIPAVIPSLTKIFQGIITGNLNDIFHGSTGFAPQNVSYAIDTVYNQVVGIAPPVSTPPTSPRPLFGQSAALPPSPPPLPGQSPLAQSSASSPQSQPSAASTQAEPLSSGQLHRRRSLQGSR